MVKTTMETFPFSDMLVFGGTDPDGDFIEVIGREHSAERGAKLITDHIGDWDGDLDKS